MLSFGRSAGVVAFVLTCSVATFGSSLGKPEMRRTFSQADFIGVVMIDRVCDDGDKRSATATLEEAWFGGTTRSLTFLVGPCFSCVEGTIAPKRRILVFLKGSGEVEAAPVSFPLRVVRVGEEDWVEFPNIRFEEFGAEAKAFDFPESTTYSRRTTGLKLAELRKLLEAYRVQQKKAA